MNHCYVMLCLVFVFFSPSCFPFFPIFPTISPVAFQSVTPIVSLRTKKYTNNTPAQQSIHFQGSVGLSSTKMIELANPTSKIAGYTVRIDGSSEFTTTISRIIIPAESSINVAVTLTPGTISHNRYSTAKNLDTWKCVLSYHTILYHIVYSAS